MRPLSPDRTKKSWGNLDHIANNLVTLFRSFENVPNIFRDAFKRLLKSLRLILLFDTNGSNVLHFADQDKSHPAVMLLVSIKSKSVVTPTKRVFSSHFTVRFRIRLSRIANANHLTLRQPRIDLLHPANFVFLSTHGQI
jgi:hypothetical protein